MSKKINFPVRLDPDVIDKINAMAVARKISIQDLLCNALEAQDREDRTAATVKERLQNMEKSMAAIVEMLRDFVPAQVQANSRIMQMYDGMRWLDFLSKKSNSPDKINALWREFAAPKGEK